jgi:hypothetical protein
MAGGHPSIEWITLIFLIAVRYAKGAYTLATIMLNPPAKQNRIMSVWVKRRSRSVVMMHGVRV